MVKKNILIVSYFFSPNSIVGAKRMSYLSFYLKKKFNFYILTVNENVIEKKDKTILFGGEKIIAKNFPKFFVPHTNFFNKIYNKICKRLAPIDIFSGWVIPAIFKGYITLKQKKIEGIIVSGPPFSHFYIGYILSKIGNIPLILDYRDPWMLNHKKTMIEKKILYSADAIIFTTAKAEKNYLNSEFGEFIKGKTHTITNAYVNKPYKTIKLEKNKKVIFYAGNFYEKRNLSYLFKPLLKLCENGHLDKNQVKIHVFSNMLKEDLIKLADLNWQNLVVQHKLVSHNEIISYMSSADLLYLPQITYGEYAIPFKFFDYISVKKPILAITPSGSSTYEIIHQLNCGETASPDDQEDIYKSLYKILIENKKYNCNVNNYSWDIVSHRYYTIINGVINY